jgi:DNA adenine methylase
MKPVIKWAGGKSKLLSKIKENIPNFSGRYFEPFLGGGAVVFDLMPKYCYVSDVNISLIEFYQVVRDEPENLITHIKQWNNDEKTFYSIRELDRDVYVFNNLPRVIRAARFMYLNKTCFNGLYRVGN